MKIAFVANSVYTFGGEQRVTCMIANELVKTHEITIYTKDVLDGTQKNPFHLSDKVTVKHYSNKTGFLDWNLRKIVRVMNRKTGILDTKKWAAFLCDMYYPPKSREELAQELNRQQYDVVIGVAGFNAMMVGLMAKQLSARTIGWMHNSYEAYFETKGLYHWNQFQMFQYSVKMLDRCFVLNEYIAGKYQESFGITCDVFYNPRSFQSDRKAQLEAPLFVACGEMNYRKGFDYLIEAFHLFAQKNADWKLLILGDGQKRGEIEGLISQYHLTERVELAGNVNNVNERMLEASAFLLSSRWEGFPMVGTEALEVGLPTISFAITAMQPLVSDGVEGLLVPPYDCQAFADAMVTLAEDKALRIKMGECAAGKAEAFTIEKITAQWESVLKMEKEARSEL